ncbi:MAG: hypothetical protein A3A51_01705 [Candidatus Levybacteria bacterium RIFCSPLOWO2_01_FULL_39_10]|nr:MAG: hypothetical protein A3A51_01705 [Candidatus Levybacteria bacterium RIFCSPLOWO2_01_FULL_39_10]
MKQKGQTLIELLITIALAAILIPALLTGFSVTRDGRAQQEQRLHATSFLKEAQEALRIVHANGWNNLSNGTFHPVTLGTTWVLVSGSETINDNLTRQIEISDVYRDSEGEITGIGGTLDPSTKRAEISVTWNTPFPTSVTSTLYLTRNKNASYQESTVEDFTPGASNSATTGIAITNTSGGEIVLGAGGGGGDWCSPTLTLEELDMPKSGVANAISAIEGRAFVGTGDNAAGVSFANVLISTPYPPVASIAGTFDGYKTNAVFGEDDYVYLATDNNAKEVEIVNLTTTPYSEIGYFNPPFNQDGNGVFVVGNVGYMTTGNVLYTFDLASKIGSRPQLDSLVITIFGTARKLWVRGNYAYIAVDGYAFKELSIVDISNPSDIREVGYADVNSAGGKEVFVNETGTRAYLATSADSSRREFFIIDVTNKSGNRPNVGSYEANGMSPKGVTVVTGNRAVLVGNNGEEYQVIDITNETNPTKCAGLQIDSGINGVSSVLQSDGFAYSYIITGDASAELKIILGGAGAGGGIYSPDGLFESATIDAGGEVAWNTLVASTSASQNTTLQFRVAVKDEVGGSCGSVTFSDSDFVGADGLVSSYFSKEGGLIPFDNDGTAYENPGRCARYRAYLSTTDITESPVVYEVSLNYSL